MFDDEREIIMLFLFTGLVLGLLCVCTGAVVALCCGYYGTSILLSSVAVVTCFVMTRL